jgi:Spy/CpxP family protein refolding chaperone
MKTAMTKNIIVKTVICLIFNLLVSASFAENAPRPEGQPRDSQPLTDQQKEQVKSIVSKYNASSLTAEDAKAIHRAFREAGLRNGPELNDAINEAGFDPDKLRDLDPPRGGQRQGDRQQREQKDEDRGGNREPQNKYSLEQAVSDNAQLHTIAFSGLAFLTGDFGACTFIPPGKVCDFFGFQYMRDIDAGQKGHNPIFLNRVAGNVMHVLDDGQKKLFLDLAEKQAPQLEKLAMMRLPLIKAFCLQKDNQIPAGSSGLNKDAVANYVGEIFAFDAQLSLERAEAMAKVYLSLTPEQKAYFAKMKFGDFNTWPALDERDQMKNQGRGKSKMFNVAYMTYASEFFSWTAGNVQADTYFCPERHGTYFGGFYMKDMPAMGKRDYDISTSFTGDSGKAFVDEVLRSEQSTLITSIIDQQRDLMKEVIDVRKTISSQLRQYLEGRTPDKQKVLDLGRRYGQLDGQMSWMYTIAFARVNQTLTSDQRAALMKLRNLEGYKSAPYYIYSSPVQEQPILNNVNVFFLNPKETSK